MGTFHSFKRARRRRFPRTTRTMRRRRTKRRRPSPTSTLTRTPRRYPEEEEEALRLPALRGGARPSSTASWAATDPGARSAGSDTCCRRRECLGNKRLLISWELCGKTDFKRLFNWGTQVEMLESFVLGRRTVGFHGTFGISSTCYSLGGRTISTLNVLYQVPEQPAIVLLRKIWKRSHLKGEYRKLHSFPLLSPPERRICRRVLRNSNGSSASSLSPPLPPGRKPACLCPRVPAGSKVSLHPLSLKIRSANIRELDENWKEVMDEEDTREEEKIHAGWPISVFPSVWAGREVCGRPLDSETMFHGTD